MHIVHSKTISGKGSTDVLAIETRRENYMNNSPRNTMENSALHDLHKEHNETSRKPLSSLNENLVMKRTIPGLREFTETVLAGKGIFRTKSNGAWFDSRNLKGAEIADPRESERNPGQNPSIFAKSKAAAINTMSRSGMSSSNVTPSFKISNKNQIRSPNMQESSAYTRNKVREVPLCFHSMRILLLLTSACRH